MIWNRFDRLFIAAATDDAQFEKLLRHYRLLRAGCFGYVAIVLVVCFVLMVWLTVDALHFVHNFQPTPLLKWLFAHPASELLIPAGAPVFLTVVAALLGISADQTVKLLLLFRAGKEAPRLPRPEEKEKHVAPPDLH